MTYDVAIVGSGPAGASCAAFCARAGLQTVVLERESFPREKVCGDCLNPSLWQVLQRLGVEDEIRAAPHGELQRVEFIGLSGRSISVELPRDAEIAIKRSEFDSILMRAARDAGAEIRERVTVTSLVRSNLWSINSHEVQARFLVAADGRNSTVARLLGLMPRVEKDRVGLQAHVPIGDFGKRVVLQFLPGGYSGQAPVDDHELNVCLVGRAASLSALRTWAARRFDLPANQAWRTITPLARRAIAPARDGLFLIGDAARVVEPFTGEGIFYALRSGELAATAIADGTESGRLNYMRQHAAMYRGRLWINQLSRAAVTSPRFGSALLEVARVRPSILQFITRKIVSAAQDDTAS